MKFLLFYSPEPGSQARILIYRNWSIVFQKDYGEMFVLYCLTSSLVSLLISDVIFLVMAINTAST